MTHSTSIFPVRFTMGELLSIFKRRAQVSVIVAGSLVVIFACMLGAVRAFNALRTGEWPAGSLATQLLVSIIAVVGVELLKRRVGAWKVEADDSGAQESNPPRDLTHLGILQLSELRTIASLTEENLIRTLELASGASEPPAASISLIEAVASKPIRDYLREIDSTIDEYSRLVRDPEKNLTEDIYKAIQWADVYNVNLQRVLLRSIENLPREKENSLASTERRIVTFVRFSLNQQYTLLVTTSAARRGLFGSFRWVSAGGRKAGGSYRPWTLDTGIRPHAH